ncbi:F-box protein family-like [Panicum miliaceum]|uniref:F-box protein family-like n=1 Tax=Panicum miliaceum TaxID=4540 RepID=A0A3L6S3K6_PANMI|nr:F-box protein family-like [Panicum miliaceum]
MDHRRGDASGLPEFGKKPWLIRFRGTTILLNPFDGRSLDVDLPAVAGSPTTCLRCFGDWSLMLDEETKDCFLLDLTSLSTIPLPPLPEPLPAWPRPGCALSSPTTLPDCTVVVVPADYAEFLLYCRPGDEEWSKFSPGNDTFLRPMHGSQGRIYATSTIDSELLVVNVDSAAGVHIEKSDGAADEDADAHLVPCYQLCPVNGDYLSEWVESGGDTFLLRMVLRDVDIHRFDASTRSFELVESVGDRTVFSAMDSVAVSPASEAGTEPDCVHLLYPSRADGLRLYTIRLRDRTVTFSLVPTEDCSLLHWAIPQSLHMKSPKSPGVGTVQPVGALSSKVSSWLMHPPSSFLQEHD